MHPASRSKPHRPRKKTAPGKVWSQGGKGRQPFPGAIGRRAALVVACVFGFRRPGRLRECIRSGPQASLPAETLRGPQERRLSQVPRCRPFHMVRTMTGATGDGFDKAVRRQSLSPTTLTCRVIREAGEYGNGQYGSRAVFTRIFLGY